MRGEAAKIEVHSDVRRESGCEDERRRGQCGDVQDSDRETHADSQSDV